MASENLTLGKGELWFSPFAPGTEVGTGFEFLGNCPEFTLTPETEKLEHYSSMRGLRQKDASIVIEKMVNGSFTCDDIRPANLARFIGGTNTTLATASATGSTFTIAEVVKGREYQLGTTASNPTGVRKITNATVAGTEDTPPTYVAGTDFVIDLDRGTIFIPLTSTLAEGVVVTYDVTASTRDLIVTGTEEIRGELKFKAYNQVGQRIDWWMPSVILTPGGDMTMISEDWTTLPFSIECLIRGDLAFLYGDGQAVVVV